MGNLQVIVGMTMKPEAEVDFVLLSLQTHGSKLESVDIIEGQSWKHVEQLVFSFRNEVT